MSVTSARHPVRLWLVFGALLLGLGGCVYDPLSGEQFFLGWLYLPWETVPRMTIDWPSILLGGGALLVLTGLLAWTLRRQTRGWPVAAAVRLVALLSLLFVVGLGTIGAAYQLIWLAQGDAADGEAMSLPLPGVMKQGLRSAAQQKCRWHMKEFGLSAYNFESAYKAFPVGGTMSSDGRGLHGWGGFLVVFGGMAWARGGLDLEVPWNEGSNAAIFRCQIAPMVNPSLPQLFDRDGFGLAHVAANSRVMPVVVHEPGKNGRKSASYAGGLRLDEFRDGRANTILLGQVADRLQPWGSPWNVRDPARGIGTPGGFSGGPEQQSALFTMADGSVRALANGTDPAILAALATPNGGEAAPSFND